ncbi:Cyclin-L1 [Armadillidium nasatum]|uniref:Cyclin-L1 n=1 Tax=Armadillidium nasatum TaxID=96803 RepID=A0A5N5SU96_9CRUS|nr:Cyclin-L1 [Armadillidium nasatum]
MEVGQMEIRHVINVFNHMKQFRNGEVFDPVILDRNYVALKNQVIRAETRLLKELGFCCHVKLPHKISIMYLRFLLADDNKKLVQSTWNFMNDSLRTDVCVRYSPETIACSCIWLAGRQLKIPLPENPPWYHVFGVNLSDIEKIAASIMKLYTRKKYWKTKVEEIRLKLQEARLRKKAVSVVVSSEEGTSFSSASGSSSPSNNSSLSKSSSPSESSSSSKSNSSSKSSSPSECNAASSRRRKRSCSERRKSNGSSRSKSRSPSRRARKKAKRSHKRSISRSRSRSHSRERYYKKKYSRSPSLAVTPRPRYIRNREGRSVSRSRLRSRSPHPNYDKKYEKKYSKQNYRYDKLERYDKHYKYVKDCKDKYAKDYRRYDHKDKSVKDLRRYDHKDKYSSKYLEKLDKNNNREMKNKYYESDYERHHRSKVNGRRRSRSKEREIRKG